MTLLGVEGKNLNSLEGRWAVDFDTPPLADAGIFAVTGPTGAGKTTVFDAICLGMYGRTPRLKAGIRIGEIVTRGREDAFAEVRFQVDGRIYRSRWDIRRRSTGEFAPASMTLSDLSDGRVLEEKKTDVVRRVEEITRLDFDRFSRTVMLAQGAFDSFLRADPATRADLLEEITGTGIYSLVSMLAYERHKTLADERMSWRERLTRLREELSDPETLARAVTNGTEETRRLTEERVRLTARRTSLEARLAALKRLEFLNKELSTQRFLDIPTLRERLTRARKAAVAGADLEALAAARVNLDTTAALHRSHQHLRDELERTLETTREKADEAERRYADLLGKIEVWEPKLREAEVLAAKAAASGEAADAATAHLREVERSVTLAREALGAEREALARDLEVVRAADSYREDHARDADLGDAIARFEVLLRLAEEVKGRETGEVGIIDLLDAYELRLLIRTRKDDLERIHDLKPLQASLGDNGLAEWEQFLREELEKLDSAERAGILGGLGLEEVKTRLIGGLEARNGDPEGFLRDMDDLADSYGLEAENFPTRAQERKERFENEGVRRERALASSATREERLVSLERDFHRAEEGLRKAKEQRDLHANERETLLAAADALFEGGAGLDEARAAKVRLPELRQQAADLKDRAHSADLAYREAATRVESTAAECDRLRDSIEVLGDRLETKARELGFATPADLESADLTEEEELSVESELRRREDELAGLRAEASRLDAELETGSRSLDDLESTLAAVRGDVEAAEAAVRASAEAVGRLVEQHERNTRMVEEAHAVEDELAKRETDLSRWAELNDLIGSKNGARFRRFVQAITLDRLCTAANGYLNSLTDRYTVQRREGADMDLEIVDGWRASTERPVDTLSGGESFVVSLAFALALSAMAGGAGRVSSLFLDEGFGTLDADTLEVVLSSLETLRATGKTIAVISHVEALKERIPVQVRVTPVSAGASKLEVLA